MASDTDKKKQADASVNHDENTWFEELNALRGLCACTVVVSHFFWAFGDGAVFPQFLKAGSIIAIYVLFILSGHVVAYRYLQDGEIESLLSAAFRRVPRILLPALWANLLYWLLATHGVFDSEEEWRRIRVHRMKADDHWCKDCITSDLGAALWTSARVIWPGENLPHFLWECTISQEIFGAAIVFLLAPISRFAVNYDIRDGADDLVRVSGLLWPRKLLRCLSGHGVWLAVVLVLGQLATHCSDVPGAMAPVDWCENAVVLGLVRLRVYDFWRTVFLFSLGLATAQMRAILTAPHKCGCSWTDALLSKWSESCRTKWALPAVLAFLGLATSTVKGMSTLDLGSSLHVRHTGQDIWLLGAAAIFMSVLMSPKEFQGVLSRSCSSLGEISFSMCLLHIGIIWAVGFPLYIWLDRSLIRNYNVVLALIAFVCATLLFYVSRIFSYAIEEPLGVWLPQRAFVFFKWLALESWKEKAKEPPKVVMSMNDALARAALALQ